jgi:hypothetical protein
MTDLDLQSQSTPGTANFSGSSSAAGEEYGHAALEPGGPIVAGSYGTWRLTYVAGKRGVARGGRLRVYTDSDTDWEKPQLADPAGDDYLTVAAPPGTGAAVRIEHVTGLMVLVQGRDLAPGERIILTYGDRRGGGRGSRAQTFAEKRRYFWIDVDATASGEFVTLAGSPHVAIVGGDAVRLVAVAPSTVVAGEPFRLLIRAEDAWGNPAHAYRATVALRSNALTLPRQEITFDEASGGVFWLEGCVAPQPGLHTIAVEDGKHQLTGESNPIRCTATSSEFALHWGDPHGGQVANASKIPDFFHYGRDIAGIAFAGYQRNDHVHSNEDYALQLAAEREFYEPGRFVPLPGFEWSAEPDYGGHHNVYFRRHGQPMRRNSHRGLADKSDESADLPHVRDLHRAYRGSDVLITPHVGGGHADLQFHEPALEPALEITSTHGSFEWFLEESLAHGYTMGFVGGSDSHDGRVGADRPGFQERRYAKGGLTGLYTADLSLEGVHEALRARRCYATTGARILAEVRADGHLMGEAYRTSEAPTIEVFVAGSAPLESVELYRGLERISTFPLPTGRSGNRVRLLWEGASRKMSYSGVVWDGWVKVAGSRIAQVETIRFDSPRSHIASAGDDLLRWHSVTCGYRSGVILHLDGGSVPEAELEFAVQTSLLCMPSFGGHGDQNPKRMAYAPAERVAFGCSVGDLEDGPRVVPVGPLNRQLTVSLAPEPDGQRIAEFTISDPSPQPGINPYWIRVVQTDMEMAWTSPIFVDFVAPST